MSMQKYLTAGHRAHDPQGLNAGLNLLGQRSFRRLERPIFSASKETDERAALLRNLIPDGPTQHRVVVFDGVQHRADGWRSFHIQLDLAVDVGQPPQVGGEHDPDQGSTWASTDNTAGRSRTIGSQLSPESEEAYTCPPVVPKYTPQGSSVSTVIALRSTFT